MSSHRRVHLVQPAVPHYRTPFIKGLGRLPGVRLSVWAPEVTDLHDSHGELDSSSIDFLPSPIRKLGPFFFQASSIRAAAEADVLILSLNIRFLDVVPAALIARARGSAVVFWGHGRSPRLSAWSTRIRDIVANLGHVYVLYSTTEATALAERGSFKKNTVVAKNTIDTEAVKAAREKVIGTESEMRRIGFVSRLYEAKRVDLLIHAFHKALIACNTDCELVIVGDGPERSNLELLTEELKLTEVVRFLGPIHDEHELASVMRTCDAFCMPEAAGLSAVHAMAYGLPIVLNDDGRSNGPEYEILEPGTNGLVFRRGDTDDLARALSSILNDQELLDRLSFGAAQTIVDKGYSVRAMTASFHTAIDIGWKASRKGQKPQLAAMLES